MHCPVNDDCRARARGQVDTLPTPRPRRALRVRRTGLLIMRNRDGAVLLERRPPSGIWGALWSFPECGVDADPGSECRTRYGFTMSATHRLAAFRHTFTHFHLDLFPMLVTGSLTELSAMEAPDRLWYNGDGRAPVGMAAPVAGLLEGLFERSSKRRPRPPPDGENR
jgi:A/G-specific adenine glycosylase